MSDQVQLYIIVAGVVILALVFGRRLLIKFKGVEIETGRGGSKQTMIASGLGSSIKKGSMEAGGSDDEQKMTAKRGGQLDDVHMKGNKGK